MWVVSRRSMRAKCRFGRAQLPHHGRSPFEGGRTVQRLEELHRIAQHAGLDVQAANCRLNITDELLSAGRFEEVVKTTGEDARSRRAALRVRAITYYNRAHALVRLNGSKRPKLPPRPCPRACQVMRISSWTYLRSWPCRTAVAEEAALMARMQCTNQARARHSPGRVGGCLDQGDSRAARTGTGSRAHRRPDAPGRGHVDERRARLGLGSIAGALGARTLRIATRSPTPAPSAAGPCECACLRQTHTAARRP